MAVYQKSSAAGGDFRGEREGRAAGGVDVAAIPVPDGEQQSPEPEPLDGYELASKLSYFLWNGPPDRKTLQLAASGALRNSWMPKSERMIEDPRFSRFVRGVHVAMVESGQVPGARTGPQEVSQTHARLRAPNCSRSRSSSCSTWCAQPAGAESDRVRFHGRQRSRRQLLRSRRQDRERLSVCCRSRTAGGIWAACSRRRRSWRGCRTAGNRIR